LEETVGRFIKVSLDTMLKIETMNPRNSLFASSSLLSGETPGVKEFRELSFESEARSDAGHNAGAGHTPAPMKLRPIGKWHKTKAARC
jgi:hypothetical protein